MAGILKCGGAAVDVTPHDSQFHFGYPHVERYSTGVHDPLLSTAMYLSDGEGDLLFIANDVIFVGKTLTQRARVRISSATGVPPHSVMITATHTHSGPITVDYISNESDVVIPRSDPAYLRLLEDGVVQAAVEACEVSQAAEVGLSIADGTGVGTNRRDPAGPADAQVPVFVARSVATGDPIACMIMYSMHPTVLHEDSTLVSADFPGATRRYLQEAVFRTGCSVLYHTGPSGNQSPRHVTRANTFAEAERLGAMLGRAVAQAVRGIGFRAAAELTSRQAFVELPKRTFPTVVEAEIRLEQARDHLDDLHRRGAPHQEVRTAEVDWFGAEETLVLARAASEGRIEASYRSCLPAEVQVLQVGPWSFVGWPGEIFVEYGLEVKAQCPDTAVISLANGELQGYIVTEEAARDGGYEASNSLFGPEAGRTLVDATLALLGNG